jgi:hypothetical protein
MFASVLDHLCCQFSGSHCQKKQTPWIKDLEKLIVAQLVKKFTTLYKTKNFISVFATAH